MLELIKAGKKAEQISKRARSLWQYLWGAGGRRESLMLLP